jgi:hypothetical protein
MRDGWLRCVGREEEEEKIDQRRRVESKRRI